MLAAIVKKSKSKSARARTVLLEFIHPMLMANIKVDYQGVFSIKDSKYEWRRRVGWEVAE